MCRCELQLQLNSSTVEFESEHLAHNFNVLCCAAGADNARTELLCRPAQSERFTFTVMRCFVAFVLELVLNKLLQLYNLLYIGQDHDY